MANVTWNGFLSSLWDNTGNWDTSALPTSSDDVFFNSTSSVDCTVNTSPSINSLTVSSGYTGRWSMMTTQDLTSATNILFDGTGTITLGNNTVMLNDGTFHIGSTYTAFGNLNSDVDLKGNCNIDVDRAFILRTVTCAYAGKTTIHTGSNTGYSSQRLILGDGTFSINATRWRLNLSGGYTAPLVVTSSTVIKGTGALQYYFNHGITPLTATLPSINLTGTTSLYITNNIATADATLSIGGDIRVQSGNITIFGSPTVSGAFAVNTNNYSISCLSLIIGHNNAIGSSTFNFGSSDVTCLNYTGSTYNSGVCNINMSTSTWRCSGNWINGSNHNMDFGTSLVIIRNGTSSITSNGKSFYDFNIDNVSFPTTFVDPWSGHNLTLIQGAYTHTGTTVTSSRNVTYGGAGTINLGDGVILSGNGTLYIESTVGTASTVNTVLTFNGSDCTLNDRKGLSVKGLTVGAGGCLESLSALAQTTVSSNANNMLTMGEDSTLTLSRLLNLDVSGSVTPYSLPTNYVLNGDGSSGGLRIRSAGLGAIDLPTLTFSGTSPVILTTLSSDGTFNMSGNWQTARLSILSDTSNLIFNSNNYSISSTVLQTGSNNSNRSCSLNYGKSAISITAYDGTTYDTTRSTSNFQESRWDCSGNWSYGSNSIVNHSWDTVVITNTSTIISNGKNFNNLVIDAPGKTVTLSDPLTTRGLGNVSGSINTGSNPLSVASDIVVVTDILSY